MAGGVARFWKGNDSVFEADLHDGPILIENAKILVGTNHIVTWM